ncbi:hypothetical protein VTO73DRAFT_9709 [Trametes versicolor]
MEFAPAFSRKTTPAAPGLADELLILEEQLYRQSCELPHTVDKALDAQLRVEYVIFSPLCVMYSLTRGTVPMDVDSSNCLTSLQDWLIDRSYTLPRNAEKALERNGVRAIGTNTPGASAAVKENVAAPITQPQAGPSTQAESEGDCAGTTTRKSKRIILKGPKKVSSATDSDEEAE